MEDRVVIDKEFFDKSLRRLLVGPCCDDAPKPPAQNATYVKAGQVIDANKTKGPLVFEGRVLRGGIYNQKEALYISDDMEYSYIKGGASLVVESRCRGGHFEILNFDAKTRNLGIRFYEKPGKEIAIVVCRLDMMDKYLFGLQEIAPFLAKHIFSDPDTYTKVTLNGFANFFSDPQGTFYNANDLSEAIKGLKTIKGSTLMLFLSVIKAMESFTKDNGLKKEVYLLTSEKESDPQNLNLVIPLTKDLNYRLSPGGFEGESAPVDWVRINCFSLGKNIDNLRELSFVTRGKFFYTDSMYEFKKELLSQVSGGHFDMREISTEIVPSKTHRMVDPDDPGIPPSDPLIPSDPFAPDPGKGPGKSTK